MDISTLNIWAVLVATISTFIIGGLWYSKPLFADAWMQSAGLSTESVQTANMGKIFGLAFLFELIMAFNLGMFLNDPSVDAVAGAMYGFLTGFGWITLALCVNSLYEQRPWKYMLINGGYWTISFTVMGLILGAWK
jgi:hypothetical protein